MNSFVQPLEETKKSRKGEMEKLRGHLICSLHMPREKQASRLRENSFFFPSLLNYKSFHFCPSSQYPPPPAPPSPPPSSSLRAVRVSCPVGSSSSSPLSPGPGRWVSKQTGSQKSRICRGNKSLRENFWWIRTPPALTATGILQLVLHKSPDELGVVCYVNQHTYIKYYTI